MSRDTSIGSPLPDALLHGWAAARSLARRLPAPVADHGGWRIDTASEAERCRYIFASPSPGITELAATIDDPGIFLKLCGSRGELAACLPRRWHCTDDHWVMTGGPCAAVAVPPGYQIVHEMDASVVSVRVMAADGSLAASGYGAAALGVFAYDRIVTDEAHRRRGLGRVVMALLGEAAPQDAAHVLIATGMGRALYETIGWRARSRYATGVIPAV